MTLITLDVEKMKRPNSGLGQFCIHLSRNLYAIEESFQFYVDKSQVGYFGEGVNYLINKPIHKLSGVNVKTDVWHCMHQEAKYFPKNKNIPIVLTIHDLNFLDKYEGQKKVRKLKKLQKLVDRVNGIVYISEYTKKIAEENLIIPKIPTKVIYNGVSISNVDEEKPNFLLDDKPFLFTIGIVGKKKNFHVLVEAMKLLPDYCLYICGNKDSTYAKEVEALLQKHNLQSRIILTGEISEGEKNWMYANCSAFVFPSLNEGFGLPVIEAMSYGAPTVISRMTALPEIGGDCAYYLDGFSKEEIADKIKLAISEDNDQKKEARKNRASSFSWETSARNYIEMYQLIENLLRK